MRHNVKKVILISIALNFIIVGFLLTYIQFFGNKIIVEPPKKTIVVPKYDLDEGVLIDESMVIYMDIYERDYTGGLIDPKNVIGFKTLIKLKKNMQLYSYMLQPPSEQHKPGHFLVSIDLGGVTNTAANLVQRNDYINLMLILDKRIGNSNKDVKVADVVLAKRKVLELVNPSGQPKGKLESAKSDFKTQYIILDMNMEDYKRYKMASLHANNYGGSLEIVICDPTQGPVTETFNVSTIDKSVEEELNKVSDRDILYTIPEKR